MAFSASSAERRSSRTIDVLLGHVVDGEFEVVRTIGAGSHADVYLARQRSLGGRTVALKILSRHYLSLSEVDFRRAGAALLREAELLGGMHAACFVDVYRTGALADGRPYIALELAEGQTLAARLAGGFKPTLDALLDILHQWAEGLAELHARKWVHRDVTPANVALAETVFGTPRVLLYDFGTASAIDGRADRHRVGFDPARPQGTPAYMSPEQALGGVVDGRADQFALAAIAYEVLTGLRPVATDPISASAVLGYLKGAGPVPMRRLDDLRPDLGPEVAAAMHRALDRQADKRFDTVQDFVRALEDAARAAPQNAPRPSFWRRWLGGGQ